MKHLIDVFCLKMEIKRIEVGTLKENCYILSKDGIFLIIDPGDDFDLIKKEIKGKVLKVLITHHHFDHIGALDDVLSYYNTSFYDFYNLKEQDYVIGPFNFRVIFNPGHSKDSISFYFPLEKVMFTGDFIFKNNIGRTDLESGNYLEMIESLKKFSKLNFDAIIYPGHGDRTTVFEEKKNIIHWTQ